MIFLKAFLCFFVGLFDILMPLFTNTLNVLRLEGMKFWRKLGGSCAFFMKEIGE
jgi:hypothetical protein